MIGSRRWVRWQWWFRSGVAVMVIVVQLCVPFVVRAQNNHGMLIVHLLDDEGIRIPVQGGCVTFFLDPGGAANHICDGSQWDGDAAGGVIAISDVPPGTYKVGVAIAPPGYRWDEDYRNSYTVIKGRVIWVALLLARDIAHVSASAPAVPAPAPGCELVELYPGYPGYRGYVTGLDGLGDYACLEELERMNYGFNRQAVDAANLTAAQRVGLAGQPVEWTWENWMAIEAELGYPPTCYACAILAAPQRTPTSGVTAIPGDPRLLIGDMWGSAAVSTLSAERGIPAWRVTSVVPTDRVLRALVGMAHPGRHLTAAQIAEGSGAVLDGLVTPGNFLDVARLWDNLIDQGGYAPTPHRAHPDDQVLMIMLGAEALAGFSVPFVSTGLYNQLQRSGTEWNAAALSGPTVSFAEWIRQSGARDWM